MFWFFVIINVFPKMLFIHMSNEYNKIARQYHLLFVNDISVRVARRMGKLFSVLQLMDGWMWGGWIFGYFRFLFSIFLFFYPNRNHRQRLLNEYSYRYFDHPYVGKHTRISLSLYFALDAFEGESQRITTTMAQWGRSRRSNTTAIMTTMERNLFQVA